jgi:hypothetical protein
MPHGRISPVNVVQHILRYCSEPLAAIQVAVRHCSSAGNGHAEGVELVGVAHCVCRTGQEADIAVAVIAVEAPGASYQRTGSH